MGLIREKGTSVMGSGSCLRRNELKPMANIHTNYEPAAVGQHPRAKSLFWKL